MPRRRAYVWNWQGNIASGVDTALYNARFTFRDESDDVGVIRLISPIGAIDSGATVTPACFVYNYGTTSPTYNVRMKIGSLYSNTALVTTHAPGTTRYVTFPTWSALPRGGLPVSCSTELMGDVESRNDRQASSVSVEVHDIGVRAIVAPTGSIPPGSVSPQARVRNYGTVREACSVSFTIPAASYAQTINLPGGLPFSDTLLADFPSWAALPGIYTAKCSTYLASDQVKGNDVLTSAFTVAAPETGWVRKSDFPLGHKSKKVRDGCCLAFLSDSSSSIYALKGSGTCEFYEYHIQSDAWVAKESVPVLGSTGKKRRVKKGATIALAEGKLYATKGSATLEFWQYNPSYPSYSSYPSYPWTEVAPVPLGAKAVREGTGAVAVTLGDTTYVYFLKGSGTFEFWRYNTIANAWEPRANAPAGVSRKPFKNGSCIAFDGANTIYAVKGFYDEFFAYDCRADAWTTQAGVPFIGRAGKKRRIKAGAGMAYRDGQVYLLKGNNTREFWNYAVDSTYHWSQLADMPLGDDKNVKGGGAIVYAPSHDALYATKGSGTFEFYKYGFTADRLPLTACRSENTQSSIFNLQSSIFNLRVSPNPFTSATFISYSLAKPGSISLKLYDATGKLVSTLASGYHTAGTSSFIVHRSSLSPGIYLLRLETENAAASGKLIVE